MQPRQSGSVFVSPPLKVASVHDQVRFQTFVPPFPVESRQTPDVGNIRRRCWSSKVLFTPRAQIERRTWQAGSVGDISFEVQVPFKHLLDHTKDSSTSEAVHRNGESQSPEQNAVEVHRRPESGDRILPSTIRSTWSLPSTRSDSCPTQTLILSPSVLHVTPGESSHRAARDSALSTIVHISATSASVMLRSCTFHVTVSRRRRTSSARSK